MGLTLFVEHCIRHIVVIMPNAVHSAWTATAAEEDSDDMFKPPKLEDEDFSPFGGKSGLFSGGKGLFDDDDEVQ